MLGGARGGHGGPVLGVCVSARTHPHAHEESTCWPGSVGAQRCSLDTRHSRPGPRSRKSSPTLTQQIQDCQSWGAWGQALRASHV